MPAIAFQTDAEMLDCQFEWLTTRARRLTLQREIRNAGRGDADAVYRVCEPRPAFDTDDLTPERVASLRALEERQQGELHDRLVAHRADPSVRTLGLDRLVLTHDLGEAEEIIVLTALCGAISEEKCAELFGDLAVGYCGNMTVEGVSRLLDAQTTADRLRVRRLLAADAPLVKGGVVVIDHFTREPLYPDDFLGARIRVTEPIFLILVGGTPPLNLVGNGR